MKQGPAQPQPEWPLSHILTPQPPAPTSLPRTPFALLLSLGSQFLYMRDLSPTLPGPLSTLDTLRLGHLPLAALLPAFYDPPLPAGPTFLDGSPWATQGIKGKETQPSLTGAALVLGLRHTQGCPGAQQELPGMVIPGLEGLGV